MIQTAITILRKDEGWRSTPYYCSEGYPTIGWGFRCGPKGAPLPDTVMSRPVGDKRMQTKCESLDEMLTSDKSVGKTYSALSTPRKAVLISMAYQLGLNGLLNFKEMWAALASENYAAAANEALDSLAAKQTPNRWMRNSYTLGTGKLATYYSQTDYKNVASL